MLEPSPEQELAIKSNSKKICIIACAGSGKTFTLTRRICRLISEHNVNPANIVAITFTNLAADRLKMELANVLHSKHAASQMFIGTIHSFCLNLLRKCYQTDLDEYTILSENKQFILLNRFWKNWRISEIDPDSNNKTALIERLVTTIDIIKMENVDLSKLKKRHPAVYRVFCEYQKFLTDNNYFDYSDLIIKTLQLLKENTAFQNCVNEYVKYLFVDEYQDIDPRQAELIQGIGKTAELCVVGDDDQSIYQFRGTDVRNIIKFARSEDCEEFVLSENRRCPQNIVQISNEIIKKVPVRLNKNIKTSIPSGLVEIKQFPSLKNEIQFIINSIKEIREKNLVDSFSEIAILLRSVSSYGQKYIASLRDAGIPVIAKGGHNLFEVPEIKTVVNVLEWIAKETLQVKDMSLLDDIFSKKFEPEKCGKNIADCTFSRDDFQQFGLSFKDYDLYCNLFKIREKYYMNKFDCLLRLIKEIIGLLDLYGKDNPDHVSYNIAQLTQIISEYEEIAGNRRLTALCAYLQNYAKRSFDEATPLDAEVNAVKVLTIHQAKGLEFDYVFIPMLVDQRFPVKVRRKRWLIDDALFPARRYHDTEENERRLFYVAVTRCRKGLFLLASRNVGLTKEKAPSIFFKEASKIRLIDKNSIPAIKTISKNRDKMIVTSYSSLEYYLTCPYRYKLIKVYGIALPINPFFEFGKVMHSVLAYINRSYNSGKQLTFKEIEQLYSSIFDARLRNPNLPSYVVAKNKRKGWIAIKSYLETKQDWLKRVHHVEIDFEYLKNNCIIRGRYDLVLKSKNGNFKIIDFKTGDKHDHLRTDFQMQLYALAALKQLDLPVDETLVYYIEKDQTTSFIVDSDFVKQAEVTLNEVIDGILSEHFFPRPGKVCKHCEVKTFCEVGGTK